MQVHTVQTVAALLATAFFTTSCLETEPDTDAERRSDLGEASSRQDMEVQPRHDDDHGHPGNNEAVDDATGTFTTVSTRGFIDLNNEFFRDLGSNGRRCVTCHVPRVGWTITPAQLEQLFQETQGGAVSDPLGLGAVFRTNDGANSPRADVSTTTKRHQAYSMLLTRGLIRIGLPMPANAEFELLAVDDPYQYASATELSLFRRPLPTTNLKFDSTVMWDGREVVLGATVASELETQASHANILHAQGPALTPAQRTSIVTFVTALASAQIYDNDARELNDKGARGGPGAVHAQTFYIGINDNFGDSQTLAPFTSTVFTIFNAWTNADGGHDVERRAVARGQALFNTKPIAITGVSGINDEPVFGMPATLTGTCSTCHNTPNGGNHSVVAPLDIGLVSASRRTPDMPLYTLRNRTTGQILQVTDPGRAMIDGKWNHIGRFKGPMLRNLAPRAPYFHNGFAATLNAVVDFYNTRFTIGLTTQEKSDMVAFLRSL